MYAFAAYLPEDVRLLAATATYIKRVDFRRPGRRTTEKGCCPIGEIAAGLPLSWMTRGEPVAGVFVEELMQRKFAPRSAERALLASVGRFIARWDRGDIETADLPRVFGIEKKREKK